MTVHPGGPYFFAGPESAAGSPLPEQLFDLAGVVHVLISDNVVTLGKLAHVEWSQLKAAIGTKIRAKLLTKVPAVLENSYALTPRFELLSKSSSTVKSTRALPRAGAGFRLSIIETVSCLSP